jgi:hypothetical protein
MKYKNDNSEITKIFFIFDDYYHSFYFSNNEIKHINEDNRKYKNNYFKDYNTCMTQEQILVAFSNLL